MRSTFAIIDSFFVGKLSYYMVTPATSFCDADSNLEKLVGGERRNQCRQKVTHKTFILVQGTFVAYETSAGLFPTDYLRPEFCIPPFLQNNAVTRKML